MLTVHDLGFVGGFSKGFLSGLDVFYRTSAISHAALTCDLASLNELLLPLRLRNTPCHRILIEPT